MPKVSQTSFMHTPFRVGLPALRAARKLDTICLRSAECGRIPQLRKAVGLRNPSHTDTIETRKIN